MTSPRRQFVVFARRLGLTLMASLCLAALVLWPVSYWRGDVLGLWLDGRPQVVLSDGGRTTVFLCAMRLSQAPLGVYADSFPRGAFHPVLSLLSDSPNRRVGWENLGVVIGDMSPVGQPGKALVLLSMPHAVVAVIAGAWPAAVAWVAVRRRRWRRSGRCAACGYDLRASTGGPCPECGTAAPSPDRRSSDTVAALPQHERQA